MLVESASETLIRDVSTAGDTTYTEAQTLIEQSWLAHRAQQKIPDREPSRMVTRMKMRLPKGSDRAIRTQIRYPRARSETGKAARRFLFSASRGDPA